MTQKEEHQGTNVQSNSCMSEGKEKKGIYRGEKKWGCLNFLSSLKNHYFNTDKQVRYTKVVRKMKKEQN